MRFNRRQALTVGGAAIAVAAAVTAVVVFGQPATSHPAQQPSLATASNSTTASTVAPTTTVAVTAAPPAPSTMPGTSAHRAPTHAVAQDTTTEGGSDPIVTGTDSFGAPLTKPAPTTGPAMCNVAPPNEPASLVPCPGS